MPEEQPAPECRTWHDVARDPLQFVEAHAGVGERVLEAFEAERMGPVAAIADDHADLPDLFRQARLGDRHAVLHQHLRLVEIGAELLSRRGEDQRLFDERESVKRRRKLDAEYHAAKEAERLTRMASEGYSADKGTSEEGEDD